MKKISLFLIGLVLVGCTKKNPSVTITNNSNEVYDSIYVYVSETKPSIFKNIKVNDQMKGNIEFDNTIKGDGSYTIKLYKNGNNTKVKSFGYYTNGASLDSSFKIVIKNDSIIIN